MYSVIIMCFISYAFLFWYEPWDNAQMRHARRCKLKSMLEEGDIDANEYFKLFEV